jgi:hypothetical protein
MISSSIEYDIEFSFFLDFSSSTVYISVNDISSESKTSYREYSELLSIISDYSFSFENFTGIDFSKLNVFSKFQDSGDKEFDGEEIVYNAIGKILIENSTTETYDGTEYDLEMSIDVSSFDKVNHIVESGRWVEEKFKKNTVKLLDQSKYSELKLISFHPKKLLVVLESSCIRRKQVIELDEIVELFEVFMDTKNMNKIKELLKIAK